MDGVVNFQMMKHPVNWAVVWIVLLIAAFAWHEGHKFVSGGSCDCNAVTLD